MSEVTGPGIDYALERIRGLVTGWMDPVAPPGGILVERDVEVPVRDGTILRVNVFRPEAPEGGARVPAIMSAHPYSKDRLPKKSPFGYHGSLFHRVMRQPHKVRFSAWTGWEAPDPGFWVPLGYAVVNIDLRGFYRSEGKGSVLSRQQGRDYHDVIEWAASRPWCSGKVGLSGVSYLAMSQWLAAAERPPHLAAICPWEGFTDPYRDLFYPGGIRERGFVHMWAGGLRKEPRNEDDAEKEQIARPLVDAWWQERTPALERIEAPTLVCGSFSDHNLHTRGSFEAFRRIASKDKWLYTHRGGKWATYYSEEALAFQRRFFDFFLKGVDNGMRDVPAVRLEVRDTGGAIHEVRSEREGPLARTRWTELHLHGDGALREEPCAARCEVTYDCARGQAVFSWTAPDDVEISGPMKLRLHVEARDADDLLIFAGVRKLRDGREIMFEGSYGFGRDLVTRGWLRASHRHVDLARSDPWRPFLTHDRVEKLSPGQIVPVDIELRPSSTLFRKGDVLRLDVQGRYFYARHHLFGQFPAAYEESDRGTAALHLGADHDAHLLVPIIPPRGS
jgi:predicted acyl esterase